MTLSPEYEKELMADPAKVAWLEEVYAGIMRNKRRQNPDEWAAANRVYPPGADMPGPRDPTFAPYMIPWERAIASGEVPLAVMVCGAQMGKTEALLDVIGERLDNHPAPIVYVGPSKEFNTDILEPRLMAMFDQAVELSKKVVRGRTIKKTRKIVSGVPIRLAHAGSSSSLKSDPAALAIVDEYDEMSENIKGQGDPLGLVRARGNTYVNFACGVTSTPSIGASDVDEKGFWKVMNSEDVQSPIWTLWQNGTRRHWAWPCLQCSEYFIPRFSCLKWDGSTPADALRTAHIVCPSCGGVMQNDDKRELNRRGVYVAPGQEVSSAGRVTGEAPDSTIESYWVSGVCSQFTHLGKIAKEYLEAVQMKDTSKIQTAINTNFGELYKVGWDNAPKWQSVAEHKSHYFHGDLPEDVVHAVTTVDVQKNKLVYVTRGWGPRATSWLLDWGEFFGETEHQEVWDNLADYITNNVCGVPIRLVLIDSGFRPGKADKFPVNKVYDFCRKYPRLVRPTKGSSQPMQVPLKVSKLDVTIKGTAQKFGLELLRLDTDHFKSWVHEHLDWPPDELGSWYIPQDVTDEYMKQLVSESRVRLASGKSLWVRHNPQNHYLDCEAMQAAAAHFLSFAQMPPTRKREVRPPERKEPIQGQGKKRTGASRLAC